MYDHWYLRTLGLPESLIREAANGFTQLSMESSDELFRQLYRSGKLRSHFEWVADGYQITDPTELEDIWSEGLSIIRTRRKEYLSPALLFDEGKKSEGKSKGIFIELLLKTLKRAARYKQISLDSSFSDEEGVWPLQETIASDEDPTDARLLRLSSDRAFLEDVRAFLEQNTKVDAREAYWKTYLLVFVEALPIEDIAHMMGCTPNVVKNRRHHILKKLKPWLTNKTEVHRSKDERR